MKIVSLISDPFGRAWNLFGTEQLRRAIPARLRKRLMQENFESGEDIAALRNFIDLTQAEFAKAIGISVDTLRNWEQGRAEAGRPGDRATAA